MKTLPIKFHELDMAVEISANAYEYEDATDECADFFIDSETGEIKDSPNSEESERLDKDERFIRVDGEEMRPDGYQLMADFTRQVESDRIREKLEIAMNGRGAFRRFKDIVIHGESEELCKLWNKFEEDVTAHAYSEWLERFNIVPDWT